MKYFSVIANIVFFGVGGYIFITSKKIPKVPRLIFGGFFISVSVLYALYTLYCILTGTRMILLY